ncbi:MAG TPA: hypothetical protein VJI97_04260 [Candidatus Nanoarchaeia archaeon]|nr:hypothetical protein [Candidatus Nanoarchaeia archaeon]
MSNKLKIDLSRPEEFIGKEFYLIVWNSKIRQRRIESLSQNSGILRRFQRSIGEVVNGLTGHTPSDPRDYDGSMIEVTLRQPHQLHGYIWPSVDSIIFESGASLGLWVPSGKDYEGYILIPDRTPIKHEQSFSMSGRTMPFNVHENSLGNPLNQRVVVHYKNLPREKVPDSLAVYC